MNDTDFMSVIDEEKLWTRSDYVSMTEFIETVDWVFEFSYLNASQNMRDLWGF